MSCSICIENFNQSTRCIVECEFCEFICCRKCCEKYILDNNQEAHCMDCKKEWDRKSLLKKFTRKFVDIDYKNHSENLLFEIEKTLLPATQPIIEEIKRKKEIQIEMNNILKQIHELQVSWNQLHQASTQKTMDDKKTFIKKCPKEDCRGFLSTQWKCGLCDYWTCPECHELKGIQKDSLHECKKENVETVQLLLKDSKPCPGCSIMIFKIEGCSQMFCTQCKTVFDWKSGRIDTGSIHNPHYFEWLRKNNKYQERNPMDIHCGREIDQLFISRLQRLGYVKKVNIKLFEEIAINLIHMRHVDLPRFISDRILNNQDLRIQYLEGTINEKQFKLTLQKRTKKIEKQRDICNVINTVLTSSTEILYRLYEDIQHSEYIITSDLSPYYSEFQELDIYINDCLRDISSIYKCKMYKVTNLMRFM